MRIIKIILLCIAISTLTNCASANKMIAPKSINYISSNKTDHVKLEYKYNLLDKKYSKKEIKKGVKLVAIKMTNNSDRDLMFGRDVTLTYGNGSEIYVMENEKAFKTLKQSPTSYLWYLLLTPLNFYTSETNSNGLQQNKSSTPIGLIIGPGLAGGNMIAAGLQIKSLKLKCYTIISTEQKLKKEKQHMD